MTTDTRPHAHGLGLRAAPGAPAPWRNTPDHYGTIAVALHWLMLGLITAVFACIELRVFFAKGSDLREGLKSWHFMLGLCVLALVAVRAVLALVSTTPPIQPAPPPWQHALGRLMHLALYGFMIAMPLLGWLTLSADGKPIPFFGLQVAALTEPSKAVAAWAKEFHALGGTVGYFLIGLHAAAALVHHYLMRDNTLLRMLPRRS
jgi:cytochrome b561